MELEAESEESKPELDETTAETVTRGGSVTSAASITDPKYFRNVVRLILQAADALQHAHDHAIVHRDIKPGNMLLDSNGSLFVSDFGLAQIDAGAGVTVTGDVLGTLRYMSPEQVLANRVMVDHRTDVYSLGATFYELFTLQPIWPGNDKAELIRQISFEEPTRPRKINPAIPVDLETIVLKAMRKSPTERYESAQAILIWKESQRRISAEAGRQIAVEEANSANERTGVINSFVIANIVDSANPIKGGSRDITVRDSLSAAIEKVDGTFENDPFSRRPFEKKPGELYVLDG